MTDTPSLVQRLNDIWSDDDHKRGCRGREYDCTCGFDERTYATAKEAAERISVLERALEPFSEMAGELFASNYNRSDPVVSIKGVTNKGSKVGMTLTFEVFLTARATLTGAR